MSFEALRTGAVIRFLYLWAREATRGETEGRKFRRRKKLKNALTALVHSTIEIVRRCNTAKGFEVLPRRWVVERTFAWLNRCRRLAKDFEAILESGVA